MAKNATCPTGRKLTEAQIKRFEKRLTTKNAVPVRFLVGGCALDIITGETTSRGSNIMYHPVYWAFTRVTAREVASLLKAKAVFSE